jgi:hypothetical protein
MHKSCCSSCGQVSWLWTQCPANRRDNKIFVPPLQTRFKSSAGISNPHQKPVPLMEELILRYCKSGGVIADWTAGVGSTAVACAIMPELNDRAGALVVTTIVVIG